MSYAQFLGQTTPYYSTEDLSLAPKNFLTYRITDTSANVIIPENTQTTVRQFVVPKGYWTYSMNFVVVDSLGDNIQTFAIQTGNGLSLPSDGLNEQVLQTSYKGNPSQNTVIDTINGVLYSDGIAPFIVSVKTTAGGGEDCYWLSYENAVQNVGVYPSIQFFKCG